jgi:ABC-type multidrug transport system fused ATPase/permease subunit
MIKFPKYFFRDSIKLLGHRGIKWLIISIIASFGIALVELSVSIVIQLLLVSFGFLSNQSRIGYLKLLPLPMPIYIITTILCITAAVRFVVQLISTQASYFLHDHVSLRLKKNSLTQMLFSDSAESRVSSSINFKISEIFVKAANFVFNISLFLSMLVQSVFLFIIMFFVSWKEAVFSSFGLLIIGITVLLINKKVSNFAKMVPKEQRKLNEGIEKIARNFIFIKLMKKRNKEQSIINEALVEYSSKSVRANFFSNFAAQTGPFLGILLLVCVILLSQSYFHTQPIFLISFIYLLARFVQSLSILSGYFGNGIIFLPQYKLALESISNSNFQVNCNDSKNEVSLFGIRKIHSIKNSHTLTPIEKELNSPNILFQDLSFAYENSISLFQNLNFEIPAGSQIGIMGQSGTGKTTLLMLLTGILKPTTGSILIDNIPADDYVSKEDIRIGYVGAEPFLIQGSLRDNLYYGLSIKVSDEEIHRVLNLVSLENLIQEKGLNYVIGEDHSGISAGQKQRICLARAILNKPSLLILDEATANLDEKNELQVAQILNNLKGQCTTVIVSHRPGILTYVDKTIYMNELLKTYK